MSGVLSGAETATCRLGLPPRTAPNPPRTNTSGGSGLPQTVNNTGYSVCIWNARPPPPCLSLKPCSVPCLPALPIPALILLILLLEPCHRHRGWRGWGMRSGQLAEIVLGMG